ncbi:hypothetical protein L1887_28812 [Cichorium endivia]|nr:hypothetical protein L1887_28812 [Cichorium endivia]
MRSDGVSKARSALGDVTNLVGKRGHSSISTSGVKTGDDCKKNEGLQFGKKERRRAENCKHENFKKEIVDCVLRFHSCSEIDSSTGNTIDGLPGLQCEIREPCPPGVRHNAESEVVVEDSSKDKVSTSIITNNGDDLTLDNVDFNKGDYLDCSRLVASQESRSSGLERCIEQKGVKCSDTNIDSIKACSCSFCMKAAYIWSDLHYQDIKGRIAAIKKSQKEASILVQRNSVDNEKGKYGKRIFNKSSKLESDLTDKWRSFFLNMEDIFALESNQLESSLLTLSDLRDNCKSDLNPTDGMHLEKK